MRLRTHKPNLRTLDKPRKRVGGSADKRMTGRKLQDRRLKIWTENPHCAACGTLTNYPDGFELDHKVRLDRGGQDTEDNCQVLCSWIDDEGNKHGCHAEKTARENGSDRVQIGPDGWPVTEK